MAKFQEFITSDKKIVAVNIEAIAYIECGDNADCYLHFGNGENPLHLSTNLAQTVKVLENAKWILPKQ